MRAALHAIAASRRPSPGPRARGASRTTTLNLFGPGTVVVMPDNEHDAGLGGSPYYSPGVVIDASSGAVVGAVPLSVIYTGDGACFLDGTLCVQQTQRGGSTDLNLWAYDTIFSELGHATVFTGQHTIGFTPAPCADYSAWFYMCSAANPAPGGLIRRMSRTGSVDSPTWGPLTRGVVAFAVSTDNQTLYYWPGSSPHDIQAWNLATNTIGPRIFDASTLPSNIGNASTFRLIPGRNTIAAVMNNVTTWHYELWQFSIATGAILTKTTLAGDPRNTDATMQVDLGAPSDYVWVRSFPGEDRVDGSQFECVRLDDGAIVVSYNVTVNELSGGVVGGVLPGTCPMFAWSGSGGVSGPPGGGTPPDTGGGGPGGGGGGGVDSGDNGASGDRGLCALEVPTAACWGAQPSGPPTVEMNGERKP